MFSPDSELLHIANHVSYRFHAMIGLDPLGNFSEIDGLSYEVPVYTYKELGRNHGPWRLPFEDPATTGEVTLRWGMIVRSKLFDWIHDVKLGKDFQKDVYIFQLSQKAIPLRLYHLSGCWPTKWEAGTMSTSGHAELATESVTLAYDNIDMANLSALAMLGELVDEPVAALVDKLRPRKGYTARARDVVRKIDNPDKESGLGRFTWNPLEEVYEAKAAEARETFEEDYEAKAGTGYRAPLEETYEALGGTAFRDALEETYKAVGGEGYRDPFEEDYEPAGRNTVDPAFAEAAKAGKSKDEKSKGGKSKDAKSDGGGAA